MMQYRFDGLIFTEMKPQQSLVEDPATTPPATTPPALLARRTSEGSLPSGSAGASSGAAPPSASALSPIGVLRAAAGRPPGALVW